MKRLLCHENLLMRFLSLYGMSLGLFLVAWLFGYHVLPEGVLRGRTGAAILAGSEAADTVLWEFLRIAAINVTVAILFVVIPNRVLAIRGIPLGYVPPIIWSILYGVTLGTNSFSIPLPERMAPTWGVLARSGLYEIAAYCLLAAATYATSVARSDSLLGLGSEQVQPRPGFVEKTHWVGVAASVLLLLAANAWEAFGIVDAVGSM